MANQIIFTGGPVLTMESPVPAQAVLIEDGVILAVGKEEEVLQKAQKGAQRVNLEGKALLPAFLDSHSHITALASTLSLVPLEGAADFDQIVSRLKASALEKGIAPGEWIMGFGYDQNALREAAHPDKTLLDRAFPSNPVVITHASGHMGVLSSKALELLHITADTPDPEGGRIGRVPGTDQPNGYLEETAFSSLKFPEQGMQQRLGLLEQAQEIYFQNGITTIQDGITRQPEFELLEQAASRGLFQADVVCYPDLKNAPELLAEHHEFLEQYQGRLKIGGAKIFLDGSPQGRTAWMSRPYEGNREYRGYPIYQDEEVDAFVRMAVRGKLQLLAHCNGDAACEQLISSFERVCGQEKARPKRPVMIHAQLVRPDQLERMQKLGMTASFFAAHVYYWGDVHRKNFGARAQSISPANSAIKQGVNYTFHQDTPVLPPDMLTTLWCAVNRMTKSGEVLGESEQISVYEALKGVTINAAWQYFEENRKGSIAPGKLADFVILDRSPLDVPVQELKNLAVIATLKEGKAVFGQL